jgi:hypothetical protein
VRQRRVRAALLFPILLLALPLCAAVAASPAAEEACGTGVRIVVKDGHVGVGAQAVSLRRFDKGAGAWEVEAVGGAVTNVPASSLALDLGFPTPHLRPGTSPMEPQSLGIPSLTHGVAGAAGVVYRAGTSEMLDASGHAANTILGVYASRRIEAG